MFGITLDLYGAQSLLITHGFKHFRVKKERNVLHYSHGIDKR